jgi:hypothetical protein
MRAGLLFMVACGAGAVVAALGDAPSLAPYIAGAGALGYFAATVAAMIPQSGTIAVDGDTVTASWRAPIRMRDRPELASWVVAGLDAAMGLVVTIRGDGGTLRIGGDKHDGEGYVLAGSPRRTVDCHVDKGELDALLAALGVVRGTPGPLIVPLVRNGQSLAGVVRNMWPLLLPIAAFGIAAVILGNTEAGERFAQSAEGRLTMAIASGAVAVIAIATMVIRSRRVRSPELELRFDDDALIVARAGGGETRVPWSAVTVEKLVHHSSSRYGTYAMPLLVLGLGDGRPLRIGTWDTTRAWPGTPAKTGRGPTWVVGTAKWPRFVDALARHGRG